MDFTSRLSQRLGIYDIRDIVSQVQTNSKKKQELYHLLFDPDDKLAYRAAWIFTHFSLQENQWLFDKQNELIDELLICKYPGKRRLILQLLYKQPVANPPRVDFLDFCMEHMISTGEAPGVQTLCMKLTYELCRSIPELLQEFQYMLEMMQPDLLPISIRTVRKNALKAIKTGKSLQKY